MYLLLLLLQTHIKFATSKCVRKNAAATINVSVFLFILCAKCFTVRKGETLFFEDSDMEKNTR